MNDGTIPENTQNSAEAPHTSSDSNLVRFDFSPFGRYFIATIALSVICSVIHIVLLFTQYDYSVGYFEAGAVAPTVLYWFMFACTLGMATMIFTVKQNHPVPVELPAYGSGVTFSAALCGFVLIALLILQFMQGFSSSGTTASLAYALRIAMMLCALPAAGYFFYLALSKKPNRNVCSTLGFFPVIWAALYLMCVYFDRTTALNNPLRILTQVSLIATMIYFLFELRFQIGKPKAKLYFMFANIALFFASVSALPKIVLAITMKWAVTIDTIYCAAEVCFLLYFITRVWSFTSVKKVPPVIDTPSPDKPKK